MLRLSGIVRRGRRAVCLAAITSLALVASTPAAAQTGQTAQIPLQFDFLNPGARSLGLGSAFVAVADDATAAFTNPAGLVLGIRKFEVSAEVRYRTLTTPYLSSGRLSGTPTGEGLDTVPRPVYGTSVDRAVRPYFVSAAYQRGRWAIAGYRHELVLQQNSFLSQGPFYRAGGVFNDARLFGLSGSRSIDVVTYGFTGAYRASSRLLIGEGISVSRFSLASRFASVGFINGFSGAADPTTAGQGSTTSQDGTGTQATFSLGALLTIRHALTVGAVYRQSASFLFTEANVVPGTPTLTRVGSFRTPGVLGAGVRLQPNDAWSLAADVDWVQYAHLTTSFITFQVDPSVADRVSVASGREFHVGVEHTFVQLASKLSLRGGTWYDPDHAVRYVSDGSGSDLDTRLKAVFPGGKSVWHYCGGFGLPLSNSLEFNFGSDFTSSRRYISASLVTRFGR